MKNKLLDVFFPRRCMLCDQLLKYGEVGVHRKCQKLLFPTAGAVCMHCGRPVTSEQVEYCFDCSRKKGVTFTQGRALYVYRGQIKMSMYRFKYSNKREYADFLAEQMLERFRDWLRRCDVEAIVPVPMYRRKQRLRGYNQAEVLAGKLHRQWQLWSKKQPDIIPPAFEPQLVVRVRDTRPQKELNDTERKNNLKNAFQTREKVVKYKKVLLIDDIYTTGSTADAIAEALYQAGVQQIFFLSVCIGQGM